MQIPANYQLKHASLAAAHHIGVLLPHRASGPAQGM